MKNDELSRRSFLSKTMSVTAAVPFLALVGAAACDKGAESGGGSGSGSGGGGGGTETSAGSGGGEAAAGPTCDLAALPEAEKTKRSALGYVDKSTAPDKNCANCNLYKEDNGAGCPGCTLFGGPVKPEGNCNSWVAKA